MGRTITIDPETLTMTLPITGHPSPETAPESTPEPAPLVLLPVHVPTRQPALYRSIRGERTVIGRVA